MPKRVFIIHRWDGSPESDWYPWLKKVLSAQKGISVEVVKMPNPSHPMMADWVHALFQYCGFPNKDTYFVGHSIGCQTILRFVESVNKKFGGAVLVTPWLHLNDEAMPTSVDREIARPWIYIPIDFEKIAKLSKNFTCIFSENDPYVPLTDAPIFKKKLGALIEIKKDRGHYTKEDGVKTPLEIFEAIDGMIKG